jgi:5'-nucleotidase
VIVLLTNDDGIGAEGLHALRRALGEVDDVDVRVIAPHRNRSGTARGITTHSPIWVQEVEFDDGGSGFATEGTPVDCVRFGDLGLLGQRPDLIVSGINHGSNLGDDVTYSGTVAAAFEGIVLGLPAVAVSQQAGIGGMGYAGREFEFEYSAAVAREVIARMIAEPLPAGTLVNINCPAGEPEGIEVTRLGKRLYDDELRLVEEGDRGRKRYNIYGFEPSFEDEEGTDLAAIARGRIAITPIHFDLTDHGELERLARWDLEALAAGLEGAKQG